MKNFTTIFLQFEDIHFSKDPGQIPFRISKKENWNAEIVCYKNQSNYDEISKYIRIKTLKNIKYHLSIIFYLIRNSKRIDVLNLFHISFPSVLFTYIYKKFNKKGIVYLKMDNCIYSGSYYWEKIIQMKSQKIKLTDIYKPSRLKKYFKDYFLKKYITYVDYFSIEDDQSKKYFENKYPIFKNKIFTIYNGHTIDIFYPEINVKSFQEKENIILTVSRLGTQEKSTDFLIKAFCLFLKENKRNWNLHLVGSLSEAFKPKLEELKKEFSEEFKYIYFHGFLKKEELFRMYNRAKIFCLPSLFETFSNVFAEAMYFGNVIVTTNTTSLKDIVTEFQLGEIIEKNNIDQLKNTFLKLTENPDLLSFYSNNSRNFCEKYLNWEILIDKLFYYLKF